MKRLTAITIVLAILLMLALAASAQDEQTTILDPELIEETSRTFFGSLNAGDVETWLTTLAEDAVSFEPVGTPPNEGHEGLLAWLGAQAGFGFESVNTVVDDVFVAGNSAAIRWTTTFVLPGGDEILLGGIDIHEYNEDGLIQTVNAYFDPTPFFTAFGG